MKSPEEQQFNNLNQKADPTENLEEKQSAIPPQYKGMPSEIVEELWQNPIYIDEAKNKSETERRQKALEEIKRAEQEREVQKEEILKQQYSNLSDEQKTKFPDAQKDAARALIECIQGKREIDDLLPEESFVLQKLKTSYENFKKENPDKTFSFDFAKDIDKSIYNNLAQRLSFSVLESKRKIDDLEKANAIRKALGVPKQKIQGDSPTMPEQNSQQNYEGLEDKDFEEFKVKNGETDTGVWWNEYSNLAAKHLKESGQFEWGKERIYFDIPLSDMEKMRDLVFEASREGQIPIAFKYLDTNKTNQIDLESNSETTRFVANFSSTEDAKKFYNILKKSEKYQAIKSDRNLDYHGYQLDKIAHYASGYREKRMSLAQIIKTARLNPDGSYTYRGLLQGNDGKWYQGKEKNMPKAMLDNFKAQFAAMPNPKDNWENTKII